MEKNETTWDNQEKCGACGSYIQGQYESEMYAGAFIFDRQRVEIRRKPKEWFKNPIILDIITQYFDGKLYRLYSSEKYFSCGGGTLHRHVWRGAFGEIPKGCHIHHKNRNTKDNRIENLECLPSKEHLSENWKHLNTGKTVFFTKSARDGAAKWHSSDEGRLWHSRMAKRAQSWTKWKRETKECLWCKKEFEGTVRSNGHSQKFCHANCKASHYRKNRKIML